MYYKKNIKYFLITSLHDNVGQLIVNQNKLITCLAPSEGFKIQKGKPKIQRKYFTTTAARATRRNDELFRVCTFFFAFSDASSLRHFVLLELSTSLESGSPVSNAVCELTCSE